jgi:hypothetical protein
MSDTVTPVTGTHPRHTRLGPLLASSAAALGSALSMTVLWFGMRGVMALGGTVATGGPYAIEHPAPGWIWVVPTSIVVLVALMLTSSGLSSAYDTPSTLLLSWSMLFVSLGWNFLEFGLRAGLEIGWLVCAVVFFIMGFGGLYTLVQMVRGVREMERERAQKSGIPEPPLVTAYVVATTVAIPIGVVLGVLAFSAVAG